MNNNELVSALRKSKNEDCVDCGYKNGCDIYGCQLMGVAADTLEKYERAIESVKEMYYAAYGAIKPFLRGVLRLFDIKVLPSADPPCMVYDLRVCFDTSAIVEVIDYINKHDCKIISIVRGPNKYIIVFLRPVRE